MPVSPKRRPILVGEDNPYSSDPQFALYPVPEGCAGERLCCVIFGMYRKDYLRLFDRANLCAHRWSEPKARARAAAIRAERALVIALGAKVARVFGCDPFEPFTLRDGGSLLVLPHPSGRCRMWNEPGAVGRARAALLSAMPAAAEWVGRYDAVMRSDA